MTKVKKKIKVDNTSIEEKLDIISNIPSSLNGMSIDEALNNLWMEIGNPIQIDKKNVVYDVRSLKLHNPLLEDHWNDYNELPANLVNFCRNPDYLHFVCKYILNIDLFPYQAAILSLAWHKPLLILIASRGAAKSYLLTVYIVLRCLLDPGIKIVVVGSALRQSMVLFGYLEKIWDEAPILQDIAGPKMRPKKDLHQGYWQCGESIVRFLPMGTGDKIRGVRAGIVCADEFSCLGNDTIIQTDEGLIRIDNYLNTNAYDLINENGELETPDKIIKTPKTNVYKIITQGGYSFRCSEIHQVKTTEGWKLAKDLTKEDFLEIDMNDYFPTRYIEKEEVVLDEKLGWLMGLLVSEGTVTNRNYIVIKNTDKNLIDKIQQEIDFNWSCYYKDAYIDTRGWDCKESWELRYCNTQFRYALKEMGLDYVDAGLKTIPRDILMSPKGVIISFLSGLYEGDGSAFYYMEHNKKRIGVAYYSKSYELIRQLQILLLKFGIMSCITIKGSKLSELPNYMLSCRGINAKKLIELLDVIKWRELVHDASYFGHKAYIRKNGERYIVSTYRANKSVHIGTYDTKKECQEAFDNYWKNTKQCVRVKSVDLLEEQEHLYDFHLPQTHSFIGNGFVQHNSINPEIFEVVVRGFAAVRAQGMKENVANAYKELLLGDLEITLDEESMGSSVMKENQIILSGTMYYSFNHFYKYYTYYRAIIQSGGNPEILKRDFPEMPIPKDLDASKYAIIRIPYDKLPLGMMDKTILSQGQATMDSAIYNMEYMCIAPKDSEGFYLASWIQNCTSPVQSDKWGKISFLPRLKGDSQKSYVMGIDPASEDDNFAINIIEKNQGYNAVVYQWTTNRKTFEDLKRSNLLQDNIKDYNTFVVKHIRHLLKRFNIELIVIDNGGGGLSVKEGLRDPDKCLDESEPLYYDMEDENVQGLQGRHIILGIDFQKAEWRRKSHYGLREDILSRTLVFPLYDGSIIEVESYSDEIKGKMLDTLEECYAEIEQCKQETILIQHTQTENGTEKWGVPRIIGMDADQVKKVLKRDRFTSLLLANWGCRYIKEEGSYPQSPTDEPFGGVAKQWKPQPTSTGRFVGKGANRMKNLPAFDLGGTDYQQGNDGRKIFF